MQCGFDRAHKNATINVLRQNKTQRATTITADREREKEELPQIERRIEIKTAKIDKLHPK